MNIYKNKFITWLIWRLFLRNPRLRLWLTRLFLQEEEVEIEIAGSKLCVNTISEIGYVRAAKNSRSNIVFRDEIASIINLALILERGDTFIDIGANVGLYSGIIGRIQHVFPSIRFYAFEANPETAKRLRKTLKGNATIIECIGLSDYDGSMRFAKGAVSGVFGSLQDASDFQDPDWTVDVPVKRLDSFDIAGNSIVMKIDVEGHEWQVLQGARGFFQAGRIKAVYLDGYKDARIPEFLQSKDFVAFDGRSMAKPPTQNFSVLFLKKACIDK